MSALREVLAAHEVRFFAIADREWGWRCTCGVTGRAISPRPEEAAKRVHLAHLEAAVLAWVEERLTGAREDVAEALNSRPDCEHEAEVNAWGWECQMCHADAALGVVRGTLGTGAGA